MNDKERSELNPSEKVEVYEIMGKKVEVPREGEWTAVLRPCGEINAVMVTSNELSKEGEVGDAFLITPKEGTRVVSEALSALGEKFEIRSLTSLSAREGGTYALIAVLEERKRNKERELTNEQLLKAAKIILSPEFQSKFREMREEKGLSMSEMTRMAGLSEAYYFNIEYGRSDLFKEGEVLLRILKVLLD